MFDWTQYSDYAEVQSLKNNTYLFRQGDNAKGFYYLDKGKVMISVLRQDGYERIIDFVFPGSLIGEQMINNTASFTSAKLLNDSVLYYFSKESFESLCNNHSEAANEFGNSLIKKVRLLANINKILNAPIEVQLAYFLLTLSKKEESETINITQASITKYISKSRVAVWKVLKEWRGNNILDINNKTIVLKDMERLQEIVKSL